MRTKTLLFLLFLTCGVVSAQVDDTIRSLVISEVRIDDARRAYVEVANVGTDSINLGDFEIGVMLPWQNNINLDYIAGANNFMMFPVKKLAPGSTFLISAWRDFGPEMWALAPEDYDPNLNKREMLTLADLLLHASESPTGDPNDSVTPTQNILVFWGGRECLYLRQHLFNHTDSGVFHVDSVLIDQVNGIWRGSDGTRWGPGQDYSPVDVAGFTNASRDATLVRKFSYKQGNMDFDQGRGETPEESEWITLPHQTGRWADNVRRLFWTAKNHGDYNLTAETLVPMQEDVIVNFADSTITVPWGVRRDDSVMFRMEYQPGFAWHYDYNNSYADSASMAAKTGDILTVIACGNDADIIPFRIIVSAPTASAKIAVPKRTKNGEGFYAGQDDPPYTITDGLEMDEIGTSRFGGIPFGTRVDTLEKYIEIPPNATSVMVWNGGTTRTDLKEGDIFRVIAEDGTTKDYYINVDGYRKSHNAYLNAINWPDMPEEFYDTYGFIGDTIPNFSRSKYSYIVTVPSIVDEIPALLAHREDLNSKVKVSRAVGLEAGITGRNISFEVTAEDDTSKKTYTVQVDLEIEEANKEIYKAEPFISEFVFREQWANNYIEVVNPGNVILDMSDYMFVWGAINTPAAAIQSTADVAAFPNRYTKYIPGLKWVDEATWTTAPATVEPDVIVDPFVLPGDVFVVADIRATGDLQNGVNDLTYETWSAAQNSDIDLSPARSPFGAGIPGSQALWLNSNWYLFKILNDSVKTGKKPATDPADFELIDVFGSGDGTTAVIGGQNMDQQTNYRRKPNIQQGNPVFLASYGTDAATSEWEMKNLAYYDSHGVPWALNHISAAEDVGSHFMLPSTDYKSTVTSLYYHVSPGFADDQSIAGIVTDATVEDIVGKLVKTNDGQTFVFKSNGDTLDVTDVVSDGDSLVVTSKNLANKTYYILSVGEGLSRDATLTSEVYDVVETGNVGNVSNIEPGTTLAEALDNVVKDAGAKLTVIDSLGAYVTNMTMGYDSTYVSTLVNDNTFFEVISESRLDTIVYKLELISDASSAFVISSVYDVEAGLISKVVEGTTAAAFLANVYPCKGATVQLVDKLGFQRIFGDVVSDDILIVTSEDGTVTQSYFIGMLGGSPTAIYVISTVYLIDQVGGVISGDDITLQTTVAALRANLTPSEGSTFEVMTSDFQPKTSGTLVNGDIVVVTGPDGVKTKEYVIHIEPSGVNNPDADSKIVAYPNPGRGMYYLSGVKAGNTISVTNILGAKVLEREATSDKDVISLEKEANGFYFITISDGKKVLGRTKVVKE